MEEKTSLGIHDFWIKKFGKRTIYFFLLEGKFRLFNFLAYSATTPKATQVNSLQIDQQHLRVETSKIVTNVLFLWCAACLDCLFVKNLLLTSEIFIHQFAKNLLGWPWQEQSHCNPIQKSNVLIYKLLLFASPTKVSTIIILY